MTLIVIVCYYILFCTYSSSSVLKLFSIFLIYFVSVPPSLLKPPVNVTKTVGETVRFNCSFSGIPRPHIRWFFHSGVSTVQLTQTGDHYVITNGLLEILQIRKEREGKYICQAVNIAGQTQAEAYLTVKGE